MSESRPNRVVWDRAKGELRVLGRRHTAVDAQALCDHLDSLVGQTVAEVIITNHEFRLGKEDAARFRKERPLATVREIIDTIIETDLLSGVGVTEVTLLESHEGAIQLEIRNPCVKGDRGAAKGLLISYWCGVLSFLLDSEFEAKHVSHKEAENVLTASIAKRG